MLEFNDNVKSDPVCHSGGAEGSDKYFEKKAAEYNIPTRAYSYKTKYHTSINKVEISEKDYQEGILKITEANKVLKRSNIDKYMNLLARNWAQVKYSNAIIAIGTIVLTGTMNNRGYINRSKYDIVDGGTGYAVMMGILEGKVVYVYDQAKKQWYMWSYLREKFIECRIPKLKVYELEFAGIGTRQLNQYGMAAIDEFFILNFD